MLVGVPVSLVVAAPLIGAVAYEVTSPGLALPVALTVLGVWLVGAFLPHRRARGALLTGAAAATTVAGTQTLLTDPLLALALISAFIAALSRVWLPAAVWGPCPPAAAARRGILVFGAAALTVGVAGRGAAELWQGALASSAVLTLAWIVASLGAVPRVSVRAGVLGSIAVGATLTALVPQPLRVVPLTLGFLVALPLLRSPTDPLSGAVIWLTDHPSRLVVGTFLGLCGIGTALLALPFSARGTSIGLLDAAFTAVSAVCVTGLVVLDTPAAFSGFGQLGILLLIQIGGLGIMTFYTVALRAIGVRIGLRHELTVAGALSVTRESRFFDALRRVLWLTFSAEALGALLLFVSFSANEPAAAALWRAVFTSVSAFCNAGFALQTDSLIPYGSDPLVLHTVAVLIVLGGLSPLAIAAMGERARGKPVALQAKLIWWMSAFLLCLGFVTFLAFEWAHSLGNMSVVDKLHNAWLQSVTLRTAGFNSVDLTETAPISRALMLAMMFVGGSPGGTAGGIKTTTAAVLLLAVAAALRGQAIISVFGRQIRHTSVFRAMAVVTSGVLTVLGGFSALLLTQDLSFDVALFETVSAVATVGLSLGGTAELDQVGKVTIMLCMFMGRVGPLTLFLFLADRRAASDWKLPDEDVDVG